MSANTVTSAAPILPSVGAKLRAVDGCSSDRFGIVTDIASSRFGSFANLKMDDGTAETCHGLNTRSSTEIGWHLVPEETPKSEAAVAAIEFHKKLAAVDLAGIPVMSTDRHIPRKEQAALARKLFKSLGLKGISVTAPNYSMASSVDVRAPKRDDYRRDSRSDVSDSDPARMANNAARVKLEAILAKAFPNHDDRSDSQSDYFDFCWSFN